MFTTTLNTPDNKVIIIPNAKLMGDIITNYSTKPIRRVDVDFTVGFGNDIEKVRACIQDVVKKDSRILTNPETLIVLKELKHGNMVFQVRSWVNNSDYWDINFYLIEEMKKQFSSQGISMPVPLQNIHVY